MGRGGRSPSICKHPWSISGDPLPLAGFHALVSCGSWRITPACKGTLLPMLYSKEPTPFQPHPKQENLGKSKPLK